jgi:hypothetical protein
MGIICRMLPPKLHRAVPKREPSAKVSTDLLLPIKTDSHASVSLV